MASNPFSVDAAPLAFATETVGFATPQPSPIVFGGADANDVDHGINVFDRTFGVAQTLGDSQGQIAGASDANRVLAFTTDLDLRVKTLSNRTFDGIVGLAGASDPMALRVGEQLNQAVPSLSGRYQIPAQGWTDLLSPEVQLLAQNNGHVADIGDDIRAMHTAKVKDILQLAQSRTLTRPEFNEFKGYLRGLHQSNTALAADGRAPVVAPALLSETLQALSYSNAYRPQQAPDLTTAVNQTVAKLSDGAISDIEQLVHFSAGDQAARRVDQGLTQALPSLAQQHQAPTLHWTDLLGRAGQETARENGYRGDFAKLQADNVARWRDAAQGGQLTLDQYRQGVQYVQSLQNRNAKLDEAGYPPVVNTPLLNATLEALNAQYAANYEAGALQRDTVEKWQAHVDTRPISGAEFNQILAIKQTNEARASNGQAPLVAPEAVSRLVDAATQNFFAHHGQMNLALARGLGEQPLTPLRQLAAKAESAQGLSAADVETGLRLLGEQYQQLRHLRNADAVLNEVGDAHNADLRGRGAAQYGEVAAYRDAFRPALAQLEQRINEFAKPIALAAVDQSLANLDANEAQRRADMNPASSAVGALRGVAGGDGRANQHARLNAETRQQRQVLRRDLQAYSGTGNPTPEHLLGRLRDSVESYDARLTETLAAQSKNLDAVRDIGRGLGEALTLFASVTASGAAVGAVTTTTANPVAGVFAGMGAGAATSTAGGEIIAILEDWYYAAFDPAGGRPTQSLTVAALQNLRGEDVDLPVGRTAGNAANGAVGSLFGSLPRYLGAVRGATTAASVNGAVDFTATAVKTLADGRITSDDAGELGASLFLGLANTGIARLGSDIPQIEGLGKQLLASAGLVTAEVAANAAAGREVGFNTTAMAIGGGLIEGSQLRAANTAARPPAGVAGDAAGAAAASSATAKPAGGEVNAADPGAAPKAPSPAPSRQDYSPATLQAESEVIGQLSDLRKLNFTLDRFAPDAGGAQLDKAITFVARNDVKPNDFAPPEAIKAIYEPPDSENQQPRRAGDIFFDNVNAQIDNADAGIEEVSQQILRLRLMDSPKGNRDQINTALNALDAQYDNIEGVPSAIDEGLKGGLKGLDEAELTTHVEVLAEQALERVDGSRQALFEQYQNLRRFVARDEVNLGSPEERVRLLNQISTRVQEVQQSVTDAGLVRLNRKADAIENVNREIANRAETLIGQNQEEIDNLGDRTDQLANTVDYIGLVSRQAREEANSAIRQNTANAEELSQVVGQNIANAEELSRVVDQNTANAEVARQLARTDANIASITNDIESAELRVLSSNAGHDDNPAIKEDIARIAEEVQTLADFIEENPDQASAAAKQSIDGLVKSVENLEDLRHKRLDITLQKCIDWISIFAGLTPFLGSTFGGIGLLNIATNAGRFAGKAAAAIAAEVTDAMRPAIDLIKQQGDLANASYMTPEDTLISPDSEFPFVRELAAARPDLQDQYLVDATHAIIGDKAEFIRASRLYEAVVEEIRLGNPDKPLYLEKDAKRGRHDLGDAINYALLDPQVAPVVAAYLQFKSAVANETSYLDENGVFRTDYGPPPSTNFDFREMYPQGGLVNSELEDSGDAFDELIRNYGSTEAGAKEDFSNYKIEVLSVNSDNVADPFAPREFPSTGIRFPGKDDLLEVGLLTTGAFALAPAFNFAGNAAFRKFRGLPVFTPQGMLACVHPKNNGLAYFIASLVGAGSNFAGVLSFLANAGVGRDNTLKALELAIAEASRQVGQSYREDVIEVLDYALGADQPKIRQSNLEGAAVTVEQFYDLANLYHYYSKRLVSLDREIMGTAEPFVYGDLESGDSQARLTSDNKIMALALASHHHARANPTSEYSFLEEMLQIRNLDGFNRDYAVRKSLPPKTNIKVNYPMAPLNELFRYSPNEAGGEGGGGLRFDSLSPRATVKKILDQAEREGSVSSKLLAELRRDADTPNPDGEQYGMTPEHQFRILEQVWGPDFDPSKDYSAYGTKF